MCNQNIHTLAAYITIIISRNIGLLASYGNTFKLGTI